MSNPDPPWALLKANPGAVVLSPQAKALGMRVEDISPARAVLSVNCRDDLVGDVSTGVIAGGVVTTLLDHACGNACFAALPMLEPVATLDLRIDYLRSAQPGSRIVAEAHCYRLTRHVAFVRALAHDGDPGNPVAAAQATFMTKSGRHSAAGRDSSQPTDTDPSKGDRT